MGQRFTRHKDAKVCQPDVGKVEQGRPPDWLNEPRPASVSDLTEMEEYENDENLLQSKSVKDVKWLTNLRTGFAFVLILVGVGAGLWMFLLINTWNERFQVNEFNLELELFSLNFELTLESYELETRMLGSAVEAIPSLTIESFRTLSWPFANEAKVRGVTIVDRVKHEDRKTVEEGLAGYNKYTGENRSFYFKLPGSFDTMPQHDEYWVITKTEPVNRNNLVGSLGIELSEQRKSQLAYINATGQPALFGPRKLRIESNDKTYSLILMVPIGHDRIVQSVIDGSTLITKSLRNQAAHLRVYLFASDGPEEPMSFAGGIGCAQDRAVFGSSNKATCEEPELLDITTLDEVRGDPSARFTGERVVDFAGGKLLILVQADEDFGSLMTPKAFLITTFVATVFLFTLLAILYLLNLRRQINFTKRLSTQEILRARKEAIAVYRAERFLNEFLAHEVRNPLSVAICATEFLQGAIQEDCARSNNTLKTCEAQQDLRLLQESLTYMNELVSNMLDLSKFSSQKITLRVQPVNVLKDVFVPIQTMLKRANDDTVAFEVDCSPDLWILADPLRLKQILMNLSKNSIKFVHKGYVRLVASAPAKSVDDKQEKDEGGVPFLEFRVEDSGPGVPLEKQSLLFQKFCSMDNRNQATGIGLSLCKILVSAMNGSVSLDPTYVSTIPGQPGACFRVLLPYQPLSDEDLEMISSECAETGVAHPVNQGPRNAVETHDDGILSIFRDGASVLIVDDEAPIRLMLRRKLTRIFPNLCCIDVSSGEAALELIQENPDRFDIIFQDHYMDHILGGMNGEESVGKYLSSHCSAMIVGCSANDLEERYLKAGAHAFFRKPIPKDSVIISALSKAIQFPQNLRFLIVDDEMVNCSILKRKVQAVVPQSHVDFVLSPEDAFRLVETSRFDIALVDGHFENTEFVGSQVAHRLRESRNVDLLISISGDPDMPANDFDAMWGKPYPSAQKMRLDLLCLLQNRRQRRRQQMDEEEQRRKEQKEQQDQTGGGEELLIDLSSSSLG